MANVDKPLGFKPLRRMGGGVVNMNSYTLDATTVAIKKGDVIVAVNAGTVDGAESSADPFVGAAPIVGIAAEDKASNAGGSILVYDDPDLVFVAQMDDGTTVGGAGSSAMNLNYDIISTASGVNTSIMEIDESSGVADADTPIKVIRLYPVEDNAHGEFARYECIWSQHQGKSSGGSLGV